jgi:hypothetical protein
MRQRPRIVGTLALTLFFASASLAALAELDDLAARHAAIESVTTRTNGITADCLKTRRKEEWEEDLFQFRREKVLQGKLNEDFFVYEVVDVGCYQVEGSSVVIHTIDHPGTWGYVAVNNRTGKTYRLWSDQDASGEFNRLLGDLGVDVRNESAAKTVAFFYRQVVLGSYKGNTVDDESEVKKLAEETFNSAFADKDWSKQFSDWWNRFKKAKKISYSDEPRKVAEGYEVTGKSFKGFNLTIPRTKISGQPTVSEWGLIVSPSGNG